MKKTYMEPSTEMVITKTGFIICGSQDITSDKDIDYGGVDEGGAKDPESRRQWNKWEEEEVEEEDGF